MPLRSTIPIRFRLPLLICGLLTVVVALYAGAAYRDEDRSETENTIQRMRDVSVQITDLLTTSMQQVLAQTRSPATVAMARRFLTAPSPRDRDLAFDSLRVLARPLTTSGGFDLLDSNGTRLRTTAEAHPPVEYRRVRELMQLVSANDTSAVGQLYALGDSVYYPILVGVDAADQRVGYVLYRRRVSSSRASGELITKLIGSDARLRFGNVSGDVWSDLYLRVPAPPRGDTISAGILDFKNQDGSAWLASSVNLARTPWQLRVEFPKTKLSARMRETLISHTALGVLVLVVGAALAFLLTRGITMALSQIGDAAAAISAGQYSRRVAVTSRDELGALGSAFNNMASSVGDTRRQLEEKISDLAASEARYRMLFKENPHPMWVYDRETLAFLAVNDTAVAHYGYEREEFARMVVSDLCACDGQAIPADQGAPCVDAAQNGGTVRQRLKDGRVIFVELSSHDIWFDGRRAKLVLSHDVTEQRRLEEHFRQAQKLEAVGRLAGGIAHDFNNLLTVILAECDLALADGVSRDSTRGSVGEIRKAAERAAILTRQLLSFSRRQVAEPSGLCVNSVVNDLSTMLTRLIGEDIDLKIQLDPLIGSTRADRGQIEQVLLNLVVNARDAMPEGGTLRIATENVRLEDAFARTNGSQSAGSYVALIVSDTGVGMSPDVQSHLFEPFFTTKGRGRGTGLGLATSYGIVRQTGGHFSVDSEPGMGTTMKVYLPRTEMPVHGAAIDEARANLGGTETILLVEDEAPVRAVASRTLASRGYTVIPAEDGEEALRRLDAHTGPLHLLLTDVVLPRIGGRELADRVRELRPDIRVLFMSGYTDDAILESRLKERDVVLLQKPFTIASLARTVRDVLDEAAAHSS